MPPQTYQRGEQTPLLQDGSQGDYTQTVQFDESGDEDNPRDWSTGKKYFQVAQIFFLALICPMAASIFAPALDQMAKDFHSSKQIVLIAQSCFMIGLGTGPLFFAPMSETFGRRVLFVLNLAVFTLLQIPTALAPNVATFIAIRMLSGFVGSVGVANGGGSIFDMFETHQRAKVLGVYLVGPLFGPTVGPLLGGIIVGSLDWRWIFWILMIMSGAVTVFTYFFLHETNAVVILQRRKNELVKENPHAKYEVDGASDMSILQKVAQVRVSTLRQSLRANESSQNSTRAVRILFTQPIVAIMSFYQALIFASLFSLYAQYEAIWTSSPYDFTKTQVGLAYLGPAIGFCIVAAISVAFIDKIYTYLSKVNNDEGLPEYRLPLANIGALLLPISLFWFGWTIEKQYMWPIPVLATVFFGASQVSVFNPVQTYYIDAYGQAAASALAAGAFLRSIIGGVTPLFVGQLYVMLLFSHALKKATGQ